MWKKPIVFEATSSGHRLHFANLVAKGLCELGAKPELWLPAHIQETENSKVFLNDAGSSYSLHYFETGSGEFGHNAATSKIVEIIRERKPFRLFLPTADGVIQTMGARSPLISAGIRKRIDAIVFRGPFAYPARSSIKAAKNRIVAKINHLAGFNSIHRVDPIAHFSIPENKRLRCREFLLPEPIEQAACEDRDAACHDLGWDAGERYLVVLGVLNCRKGIDKLIPAFVASNIGSDVKLVLAGPQSAEVQKVLMSCSSEQRSRILVENSVIPESRFDLMLTASNWLAATYPRHIGSSGIVLRANQYKRPVIASSFGWIGWATKAFNLGIAVDASSVSEIRNAIGSAANSNLKFQCTPANRQLARYHSVENFKLHYLRNYTEAHGAFSDVDIVPWSSVEKEVDSNSALLCN